MTAKRPPEVAALPQRKVTLDWRAYFIEFCRVHGEPVRYKDRLLFRDGFTYSATDYQGPEYPPPQDLNELDKLTLTYWKLRRQHLNTLMRSLLAEKKQLTEVQAGRSVPLQQVATIHEDGVAKKGYRSVDFDALNAKIAWVRDDLQECAERLRDPIRVKVVEKIRKRKVG